MFAKRQERMEKFVVDGSPASPEHKNGESKSHDRSSAEDFQKNPDCDSVFGNDPPVSTSSISHKSFFAASESSMTSKLDTSSQRNQFVKTDEKRDAISHSAPFQSDTEWCSRSDESFSRSSTRITDQTISD